MMNLEVKFKHIFWLVVLSISWGANYLFVRIAVLDLTPLTVMAIRGITACAFLIPVLFIMKKPWLSYLTHWRMQLTCIICGALIAYMWFTMAEAEMQITASMASLLIVFSPIFSWFIGTFIYREKPFYILNVGGIFIAIFGLIIMIGLRNLKSASDELWMILFYASGLLGFAISAALSRHHSRHTDAFSTVTFTVIYATIFTIIPTLLVPSTYTVNYTWAAILASAGTGIISTGVAYLIYFWLVADTGQIFASSSGYLVPISGFILGVLLLNEPYYTHQIIGLAIVFVGTYLANKQLKKTSMSISKH